MSWPEAIFYSVAALSAAVFLVHMAGGFRITVRHERADGEEDQE